MGPGPSERQIFTLQDAQALLPAVQQLTAEAVGRAESLADRISGLSETDPERARLAADLNEIVGGWASRLRSMGAEVKGLWLVDFDNGQGYYCWSYPEEILAHYHDYDDGFDGRMKIV